MGNAEMGQGISTIGGKRVTGTRFEGARRGATPETRWQPPVWRWAVPLLAALVPLAGCSCTREADERSGARRVATSRPAGEQPGGAQKPAAEAGAAQSGAAQPGTSQPGTAQPSTGQPSTGQPGDGRPASNPPGGAAATEPGAPDPGVRRASHEAGEPGSDGAAKETERSAGDSRGEAPPAAGRLARADAARGAPGGAAQGSGAQGEAVTPPELHVVGFYRGNRRDPLQDPTPFARVRVTRQGAPLVLVLSGYEPIEWRLEVAEGARLERVILAGFHPQTVVGLPDGVALEDMSHAAGNFDSFYAYKLNDRRYVDMEAKLRFRTGLEIASFQGNQQYLGPPVEVGGGEAP